MKRTSPLQSAVCGISGAMLLMSGCAAHTQTIREGIWLGTMTAPPVSGAGRRASRTVSYEVVVEGDGLRITLIGPYGNIPMRDVRVDPESLRFSFVGEMASTGRRFTGWFDCELELLENQVYRGDCKTPAGFRGRAGLLLEAGLGSLIMIPPGDPSP